jgi:hypothetical protein
MSVILENIETKKVEVVNSQVAVRMMTGIDVMNQLPGVEGNGYRIISLFYPTNPAHRAALAHALA